MLSELNDNTVITEEMIALAERYRLDKYSIRGLRERPRTWGQLKRLRPDLATWAMITIPNCPIEMDMLLSRDKARVMVRRKDHPVELGDLSSEDMAWVMVCRKDCPLDYKGLSDTQRDRVIAIRKREGWPV